MIDLAASIASRRARSLRRSADRCEARPVLTSVLWAVVQAAAVARVWRALRALSVEVRRADAGKHAERNRQVLAEERQAGGWSFALRGLPGDAWVDHGSRHCRPGTIL